MKNQSQLFSGRKWWTKTKTRECRNAKIKTKEWLKEHHGKSAVKTPDDPDTYQDVLWKIPALPLSKSTKHLLMSIYDLSSADEVGNRSTLQCNFECLQSANIGWKVNCELSKICLNFTGKGQILKTSCFSSYILNTKYQKDQC